LNGILLPDNSFQSGDKLILIQRGLFFLVQETSQPDEGNLLVFEAAV
jgi:hypothetical protein